jgi:L-ribulose-5-phosphate 4-epimerase
MPAVLVAGHGSFCWGIGVADAVHTATMLEMVARLAFDTVTLAPIATPISGALLDTHFRRKHGPAAYYGQPGGA